MVASRIKHMIFGFQGRILLALLLGLVCGKYPLPYQDAVAHGLMTAFMNILKLTSLPIIFLALSSTIMGMDTWDQFARLGRHTVRATLQTTVAAAALALGIYVIVKPAAHPLVSAVAAPESSKTFSEHLMSLVPSHIAQPFADGNVIAVLALATTFGIAMLGVEDRAAVHKPFVATLQGLMRIIRWVTLAVPVVVWAGIVESFEMLRDTGVQGALLRYLGCVLAANLLQAFVVLPNFLRANGLPVRKLLSAFGPALNMAFFSKSSVASMPTAIRCAEERAGISPKVARFTFPMCTTINMNGCAAFILLTVLFVAEQHGRTFSALHLLAYVLIATAAAVGNAGVPMGCYFLASAMLAAMDVPLNIMTVILPFYSFIDMLETAVNVWSDACVASMVNDRVAADELSTQPAAVTAHAA